MTRRPNLFEQLSRPRPDWAWVDGLDPHGDHPRPSPDRRHGRDDGEPEDDWADLIPRRDTDPLQDLHDTDDPPHSGTADTETGPSPDTSDHHHDEAPIRDPWTRDPDETMVLPTQDEADTPETHGTEPSRTITEDGRKHGTAGRMLRILAAGLAVVILLLAALVALAPSGPSQEDMDTAASSLAREDATLTGAIKDKESRRLAGDRLSARADARGKANRTLLARARKAEPSDDLINRLTAAAKETRRLDREVRKTIAAKRLEESRARLDQAVAKARETIAATPVDDLTRAPLDTLNALLDSADKTRSGKDAHAIDEYTAQVTDATSRTTAKAEESRRAAEEAQARQEAERQAQERQSQAQATAPSTPSAPRTSPTPSAPAPATPTPQPQQQQQSQDNTGVNVG